MTAYLAGCSAGKLARPAPARELYTGPLFRLSLRAAEAAAGPGDVILVISALLGLIGLDELVTPYDRTMAHPLAVTAAEIARQARARGIVHDPAVVLAPKAYAAVVTGAWTPGLVTCPLAGARGIGDMRHILSVIARTGQLGGSGEEGRRPGREGRPLVRDGGGA